MPILVAPSRPFDIEVEVLIVGGGACGLTAALSAFDAGATPLVLERWASCAGSSAMSLGALCAAGTQEQHIHGVEDSAALFLADIMAKTGTKADPLTARTIAEASGIALDWLAQQHGIVFELDLGWRPAFGHSRQRLHAVKERTGADMMTRLINGCEAKGIDILTDAHVIDLFADEDGTVAGVRMQRPDASIEDIGCKTLVLATCGFGGNREMVANYIPTMKTARYFGWEPNQGDAIVWGQALGAAIADMDAYQGLGLLADPQGIDVNPKLLIEGGIQINSLGQRFSNELDDVSGQGARLIAQPEGYGWVIYDQRIHQIALGFPQYQTLMELGALKVADESAQLALLIGVDGVQLKSTVDEVIRLQTLGGTDEFGRVFEQIPLDGPLYGLRVTG